MQCVTWQRGRSRGCLTSYQRGPWQHTNNETNACAKPQSFSESNKGMKGDWLPAFCPNGNVNFTLSLTIQFRFNFSRNSKLEYIYGAPECTLSCILFISLMDSLYRSLLFSWIKKNAASEVQTKGTPAAACIICIYIQSARFHDPNSVLQSAGESGTGVSKDQNHSYGRWRDSTVSFSLVQYISAHNQALNNNNLNRAFSSTERGV